MCVALVLSLVVQGQSKRGYELIRYEPENQVVNIIKLTTSDSCACALFGMGGSKASEGS